MQNTTFAAYLGTLPEPIGTGETEAAAIDDAIREVRLQDGIGDEPHQFVSEDAVREALAVRRA